MYGKEKYYFCVLHIFLCCTTRQWWWKEIESGGHQWDGPPEAEALLLMND